MNMLSSKHQKVQDSEKKITFKLTSEYQEAKCHHLVFNEH